MRHQKRRGLLFGALAVALAVITGLLFTSQITALERKIGDLQRVVVVKQDIPARTLLTPELLEVTELPRQWAHPAYVQSIEDVVNQRVTVVSLMKGAIIRQSDVAPINGLEGGWRAVSIGVNPVAVLADRVQPGSRVDVVVSYELTYLDEQGGQVSEKRTTTLINDVEVLAVAGGPEPEINRPLPTGEEEEEPEGLSEQDRKRLLRLSNDVIATLKVQPGDAQQLAYMDTYATDIRLAMRRADDRAIEPLPPVSEEDFR